MTSTSKFVLLTIFGFFLGGIIPLLLGWLRGFPFGMLSAFFFWMDWVLFSALLGAVTVHFFFTMEDQGLWGIVIHRSSSKKFMLGIMLATIACGVFYWQRQSTVNAIVGRFTAFCSTVQKQDDEAAYAFMSPGYRQQVSLDAFKETLNRESINGRPSFSGICSHPISSKWAVAIWGNNSQFADPGWDFYDGFAYKIVYNLKNVNGEWYLDSEPIQGGLD